MCYFCEQFNTDKIEHCAPIITSGVDIDPLKNELTVTLWHSESEDSKNHTIDVDCCNKSGKEILHLMMPIYFCPVCGKELR